MFYIQPGDDADRGNKKAALDRLDTPENFNPGSFHRNLSNVATSSYIEITAKALDKGNMRAYHAALTFIKKEGEHIDLLIEGNPEKLKGRDTSNAPINRSYEVLPELIKQATQRQVNTGKDDALKGVVKSCQNHPMFAMSCAKVLDEYETQELDDAQQKQLAEIKEKLFNDHPEVENQLNGKTFDQLNKALVKFKCNAYMQDFVRHALKTGNTQNIEAIISLQPEGTSMQHVVANEILSHGLKTGDTSYLHHLGRNFTDGTIPPLEKMLEHVDNANKQLDSPHLDAVTKEIQAIHQEKRRAVPFFRCQDMLDEEEFNPTEFSQAYEQLNDKRMSYISKQVAEKDHREAIEALVRGDSKYILRDVIQHANDNQNLEAVQFCQEVCADDETRIKKFNKAAAQGLEPVTPEFVDFRRKAIRQHSVATQKPIDRVAVALKDQRSFYKQYQPSVEEFKEDLAQADYVELRSLTLEFVSSKLDDSSYFDELIRRAPNDQEKAEPFFEEDEAEYKHMLGKKAVERSIEQGKFDCLQSVLGAHGADEHMRNGIQEGLAEYSQAKREKEAQRKESQDQIQMLEGRIAEQEAYISGKGMKFSERIALKLGLKDQEVNSLVRQNKSCKWELDQHKEELAKLQPTDAELARNANHLAANEVVDNFYEEPSKGPAIIQRDYA